MTDVPQKKSPPRASAARHSALQALCALERQGFRAHAEELLAREFRRHNLDERDRRLAYRIVEGCLRNKTLLEHVLGNYCHTRVNDLDLPLRWILVAGLYQCMYLEQPAYAVVNESQLLCVQRQRSSWRGLVNAVLRAAVRAGCSVEDAHRCAPDMATRYSHPEWLIARFEAACGRRRAEQLLAWNNATPRHYARVRMGAMQTVLQELGDAVSQQPTFGDTIVEISDISEVLKSRSFADGEVYICDPWSLTCLAGLPVQAGWRVLDLCAAPGGKSIALADRGDVHVVATDISPARLETLVANCQRCRCPDVEPVVMDGKQAPDKFGTHAFDCVVVDAPCSNLGVVQRHPEIRWRLTEADIQTYQAVQRALLSAARRCVKPGGYLLYAVCTITPEETDAVASAHTDLRCIERVLRLPGENGINGGYHSLWQIPATDASA
jgi:16S rRNA (cytosine967-C5)-methyltransferase